MFFSSNLRCTKIYEEREISFCEVKGYWDIKNTQLKKILGKHKKVGILYFTE